MNCIIVYRGYAIAKFNGNYNEVNSWLFRHGFSIDTIVPYDKGTVKVMVKRWKGELK